MDKNTTSLMLMILNDCGDYEHLNVSANHRVPIYLAGVALLPELQQQVKDYADTVVTDVLIEDNDPDETLRDFNRHAEAMEQLAYLISVARS